MAERPPPEQPSLGERFDPTVRQQVQTARRRGVARLRSYAVGRSPLHYERGDMRRDYGWQRAAFLTAVTTGLLALACRVVLTGLFVAFVSPDVSRIAAFNAALSGVTALAGVVATLTGPAVWRSWRRRLVGAARRRRRRRDQPSIAVVVGRRRGRRRRGRHGRGRSRARQVYRPR
ncbi:hypothetical protein [Halomarina litorea]|uniref:hypothetical protein n=1 Tax=Halomarina litorea TaxID=2961595 RepID=UPI0020C23522|nr:hypothetical protein [Halomarina sp. BCD28]